MMTLFWLMALVEGQTSLTTHQYKPSVGLTMAPTRYALANIWRVPRSAFSFWTCIDSHSLIQRCGITSHLFWRFLLSEKPQTRMERKSELMVRLLIAASSVLQLYYTRLLLKFRMTTTRLSNVRSPHALTRSQVSRRRVYNSSSGGIYLTMTRKQ